MEYRNELAVQAAENTLRKNEYQESRHREAISTNLKYEAHKRHVSKEVALELNRLR